MSEDQTQPTPVKTRAPPVRVRPTIEEHVAITTDLQRQLASSQALVERLTASLNANSKHFEKITGAAVAAVAIATIVGSIIGSLLV